MTISDAGSRTRPHDIPSVSMVGSRGYPGQHGGVERVLEAVCPRLAGSGRAKVRVYCARWLESADEVVDGVALKRVSGLRTKYGDTFSRSLLATFRELFGGSAIVHYHSIGSAPLSILPRLFGKKVVVTVHGLDWQRSKWNSIGKRFLKFGEWASVRFPHRTIAVGPEIQQYLESEYGRPVTFIPNGAERRDPVAPSHLEANGLVSRSYLLFVGRIVPEKGVHVLIEAFRQLPPELNVQLALAGPLWYETEYHDELERMIDGDRRVKFLGEVTDELLSELYSNAAGYVLPSEVEGMSLSLLDAMAFGSAIVTSSIPPNANLIGDAGLVFETGDADDLRRCLFELLSDPEHAAEMRMRSRERAEGEFNWDRISDQWADIYDELIAT